MFDDFRKELAEMNINELSYIMDIDIKDKSDKSTFLKTIKEFKGLRPRREVRVGFAGQPRGRKNIVAQ